jgi:hypothetical protein
MQWPKEQNEFHESRLFQKRVVCTKFDIYVFTFFTTNHYTEN